MVERDDSAAVATFFSPTPVRAGTVSLGEAVAQHVRVRRLVEGTPVRLTDGAGTLGTGKITRIARGDVDIAVDYVASVPRPPGICLFVPVADRDRMLWIAEKAAELAIETWQPVMFHRSKSVAPRGEGEGFAARARARMIAALEQSGGAWLPDVRRDVTLDWAAVAAPDAARYVLDKGAEPIMSLPIRSPAAVIIGPEGGMEPQEMALLQKHGWRRCSLGDTTLRFETAALASLAVLRAALTLHHEG